MTNKGSIEDRRNFQAAGLVMLSGVLFSTVSLLVKIIGHDFTVIQIAFFRALFGLLWILPFVFSQGIKTLKTTRPISHLLRGGFGMGAMFCSFYAAVHMPLADATAITFTKPFFVVFFAVFVLGERLRTERMVAILVGFFGMVLILHPGVHTSVAAYVALLGAVFMALVVIMLSLLGRSEPSVTVMFYFGLISTVIALIPTWFTWKWPTAEQTCLLLLIGACGAAAQTIMLKGFSIGESTLLVNFEYIQLVYAAAFGFIFFGNIPSEWTIVGGIIIISSAAFVVRGRARSVKAS